MATKQVGWIGPRMIGFGHADTVTSLDCFGYLLAAKICPNQVGSRKAGLLEAATVDGLKIRPGFDYGRLFHVMPSFVEFDAVGGYGQPTP